jgi:hypothetical protein
MEYKTNGLTQIMMELKNIPDSNGAIDYSLWEWIDFNGDNSYKGKKILES